MATAQQLGGQIRDKLIDLADVASSAVDKMDSEHDKSEYDSTTDDLGNTRFAFGDIYNFASRIANMIGSDRLPSSLSAVSEGMATLGDKVDKLLAIADGCGYGDEADEIGGMWSEAADMAGEMDQTLDDDENPEL